MASSRHRELAEALQPLARQAAKLGIPWLLIGAAGRDVVLFHSTGQGPGRATHDVDVAVFVQSWQEFTALKDALIREERATAARGVPQRIQLDGGPPLDIVPFGGVESDGTVAWIPGDNPVMNVRGLKEAYATAVEIELIAGLCIRVPTFEMLLCLKLFAWRDRHVDLPRHDSVDIADLLENADNLIPLEVLYDDHQAVMEENAFDAGQATMQILGERLGRGLEPSTLGDLLQLLELEIDEDGPLALLTEMGTAHAPLPKLRGLVCGLRA